LKKLFVLGAVSLLFANAAFAGVLNEKGAYMGLALGKSKFDDDNQYGFSLADDKDSSFMLYGGYRFFKWFSVEGRLADLGEFKVDDSGLVDVNYGVLTANAVFILPFGTSGWEIYGQAGAGIVARSTSLPIGDDEGGVATIGAGVRFTPIKNLSLALQIDGYGWVEEEDGAPDYDTSIATSQLVIQYNF